MFTSRWAEIDWHVSPDDYANTRRGGEFFIMLTVKIYRRSSKGNYASETAIEKTRVLKKMPEHTGRPATETRKIERILVPIDFSRSSEAGVRYALNVAREFGAEVIVYHVITTNSITAFGRARRKRALVDDRFYGLIDACKLRLRRFVERIRGDAGTEVRVREKAEFGTPEKNIARAAAEEKADLIVLGMSRKGRLTRLFSSGVTEKVTRQAPCPVLAVPAEFTVAGHENLYKKAA
jgi:nucleotide-binding universal stress UspA family protein